MLYLQLVVAPFSDARQDFVGLGEGGVLGLRPRVIEPRYHPVDLPHLRRVQLSRHISKLPDEFRIDIGGGGNMRSHHNNKQPFVNYFYRAIPGRLSAREDKNKAGA